MNIRQIFDRLWKRAGEVRSSPVWDADSRGPRIANWSGIPTSPNQWLDNPILLRTRAEGEYKNNGWARKIVDAIVNAAVGASGINAKFQDKAVAQAWEQWGDRCDAAGRLDWVAVEQLILQSVIVSGECFVQFVLNPDLPVPLSLAVMGPEFLDTSRSDEQTQQGIQFDERGRRTGYWLFERHPSLGMASLKSVFVPASDCLHIFRPTHPGAQRGVSWLAPVLLALRELAEYHEAALVKAKVSSLYAGFVQTPDGSNPLNAANGVPTLEPGSMCRLQPGEVVEFSTPVDQGTSFDPFVRSMLRKIASGANVPYEILSGDLSAVTFASGRHGLLEWRRQIEAIQHVLIVPQFCTRVLPRWMQLAVASGVIESPSKARWIGPQIALLDEKAETSATIMKIRAGLTSRSEAVLATGWTAEQIDSEIAADNARADSLGLVLDSDPRKVTQQGQEQQGVGDAAAN